MLDREHDYWRSSHDGGYGPVATGEETMGRAVYVATLTRSLTAADAAAALRRAGAAETAAGCGPLLADHARCYPPADPGLMLEPLMPDRLGEDYLALSLPGHEEEFGYYATDPWTQTAPGRLLEPADEGAMHAGYTRQALTVMIEAAHRWPHLTARHLDPILRRRPALALEAGSAALTRLAELPSLDLAVLEAIEPHLPNQAHIELDAGAAAVTARLTRHQLAATSDPAAQARLYGHLGWRYSNAGLDRQALEATSKAVDLYRRLADTDPAARLPNLAHELSSLGVRLARVGEREQALSASQEAVAIRRRLATASPSRHRARLAGELHNLAVRLVQVGRREDALSPGREAAAIKRELAGKNPSRYQPELALTLDALGGLLASIHRVDSGALIFWSFGRRGCFAGRSDRRVAVRAGSPGPWSWWGGAALVVRSGSAGARCVSTG
jgi:tetratricopeptide (TPR) repeat protein